MPSQFPGARKKHTTAAKAWKKGGLLAKSFGTKGSGAPNTNWFGFTNGKQQAEQNDTSLLHAGGVPPNGFWRRARRKSEPGWLPADHKLITKLVFGLVPLLLKPPPAPIVVAQRPEPLPPPTCSDSNLWRGKRSVPARIIDILMFGFELDLLEIRLHELEEVVETHVVWEGAYSQRGTPKPLLLGAAMSRFVRFRDRILYLAQDDARFRQMVSDDAAKTRHRVAQPWVDLLVNGTQAWVTMPGVSWINENHRQEAAEAWLRMEGIRKEQRRQKRQSGRAPESTVNGAGRRRMQEEGASTSINASSTQAAGEEEEEEGEVLLMFSDLDEIPNAVAINELKHCEPLPEWRNPKGGLTAVPPMRFGFTVWMHDLEHGCCEPNFKARTGPRASTMPPMNINILRPSDLAAGMPMRYTGYPHAPPALGLGAHLTRCMPPAPFMLKSWLQCDTHEFRSDYEQKLALDLNGWFEHAKSSWQHERTGTRRVRELTGPNRTYVSLYESELPKRGTPYRFAKPWSPWFAEENKARFPYLFPSLFPEALRHYQL